MTQELEAEFRRRFVSALRPHCLCEYMSSMNKTGVPDVHVVIDGGRAAWLELKAVDGLPSRDGSNVLGHRFTGPQLAFAARVVRRGAVGAGVIGFKRQRNWYCALVPLGDIGADGTVTKTVLTTLPAHALAAEFFAPRFLESLKRA